MSESPMFTFVGAPYLEYLPVVDLATGRLLGMEALVRWQHPQEGRISPNELIPQAEATGDIAPLTRWVLMEACNQARQWSPSIQLGVNCTVEQLRRGEVSKAVADALEKTGLRSGQLTLEVTEDAVVDPVASADLRMLSDIGVQLSVDDVGTNWSSFEPFRRHNISTVKIDGSFIAGLERSQGINRLVVETVIHMAHSLAMSALVEAVETPAQVSIVREFNADAAQGFFFARPMSSEDAALFGAGPEVPQFSRTELRTLMRSHPGPIAGPDEVESTEVVAAEVSAAAVRRYGGGSAVRRVNDNLTAADDATADQSIADDATADRTAADAATADRTAADNATDNATADPKPTTGAAADGTTTDDGPSGGVAASNGTGEPVRGGGVIFANDGDREELDSLPEPSEDDDETLPHPFSSPLAINPLRHEAV
jgi:EAL domain-containing protein (putative c-di-GMP-specific phosphodiesterase class I)